METEFIFFQMLQSEMATSHMTFLCFLSFSMYPATLNISHDLLFLRAQKYFKVLYAHFLLRRGLFLCPFMLMYFLKLFSPIMIAISVVKVCVKSRFLCHSTFSMPCWVLGSGICTSYWTIIYLVYCINFQWPQFVFVDLMTPFTEMLWAWW